MADNNRLTNLILTMGIRFWRTAVDILKIRDLHHCEAVLADLCRLLTISLKPFDLRTDSNLIMSHGVSFWLDTVRDQNIKDVTHSEAVISYLQGFLDVINQDENGPENAQDSDNKVIGYEDDSLKVIKFTRPDYELVKKDPEENDVRDDDNFEDDHGDNNHDDDDDWEPSSEKDFNQLCLPSPEDIETVKSEQMSVKEQIMEENERIKKKIMEENGGTKKKECIQMKKTGSNPRKKKKESREVYCDYCGTKFITAFRAAEHVDECHPEKKEEFDRKYLIYECVKPGCQKVFYIRTSLSKHYKKFHKDFKQSTSIHNVKPEKAVARCSECRRNFLILSNYEDHMEEHKHGLGTKLFECDVCKARFNFRTKLEKHKLRHEDLSSICPECGKSLSCKSKMYRHLESHKQQKKQKGKPKPEYKECPFCNQMVPHSSHRTHMYKFHDHKAEFCDLCGKKCQGRQHLERHIMRMHSTEKNHCCNICGKKFSDPYDLKRHNESQHHEGPWLYNCDKCGKGFMSKQIYEGHLNMHLGIKPYKCEGCGTGFQNPSNLLAHKKKTCKQLY